MEETGCEVIRGASTTPAVKGIGEGEREGRMPRSRLLGINIVVFALCLFHHHHLPLNREGRWGIIDDFATSSLHFSLAKLFMY